MPIHPLNPTLDGDQVTIGDGTATKRLLRFETGDYTLPAWLRLGINRTEKISALPHQISSKETTARAFSSEPTNTIDKTALLPQGKPDPSEVSTIGWTSYTVRSTGGDYNVWQTAANQAVSDGATAPVRLIGEVQYNGGAVGNLLGRSGSTHIIQFESENLSSLPPHGSRLLDTRQHLTRIYGPVAGTGSFNPAVQARHGSSYYRFLGIEWSIEDDAVLRTFSNVVELSPGSTSRTWGEPTTASETMTNVIVDRCHGWMQDNDLRGWSYLLNLSASDSAAVGCHIMGGQRYREDHAIGTVQAQRVLIENNLATAANENVFIGAGPVPVIDGVDMHPEHLWVLRNHLHKPLRWIGYTPVNIKNNIEWKDVVYALVQGNIMENNWKDGQTGKMMLIRATNQSRDARNNHGTVRYNYFVNGSAMMDVNTSNDATGVDANAGRNLSIHDNLGVQLALLSSRDDGQNNAIMVNGKATHPFKDLDIWHNTFINSNATGLGGVLTDADCYLGSDVAAAQQVRFNDNVLDMQSRGMRCDATAEGVLSFDKRWQGGWELRYNVLAGADPQASYTSSGTYGLSEGNSFPAASNHAVPFTPAAHESAFVAYTQGKPSDIADFKLSAGHGYGSTDGRDPGADIDTLKTEIAGVDTGITDYLT